MNILQGAIIGLVTAAVFQGVGSKFNVDMAKGGGNFWAADVKCGARHIFSHAVAGGVFSAIQGGKFGHGFVSAGLSKGFDANFIMDGSGPGAFVGETVVVAVVGGTISKMTGGKFANGAASAAFSYAMSWAASRIGAGGTTSDDPDVSAKKSRGGISNSGSSNKAVPEEIMKDLAVKLDLPEGEYVAVFASAKEIEALTNGQAAWGTVDSKNGYRILMDESLAGKMDGTRFVQTLSEEMVHVWQLRSGYVRLLPRSPINRYAIESEATGWVMSKAGVLGLKTNSRDYRDYVRVNKMWEKKWETSVY